MRLHADVRLLWFEVVGAPVAVDEKKRAKAKAYPRGKLPVCRVPAEMRPLESDRTRQLVLAPGEQWTATFDPVLQCGAMKLDGELTAGAVVYPSYGYPTPPRPKWKKAPKEDDPDLPFVAERSEKSDDPPVRLVEGVVAIVPPRPPVPRAEDAPPTGEKPAGEAPAKAPPVEPVHPQMTLETAHRADASRGAEVVVTAVLSYEGKRKTSVHVRADDLDFDVVTPTGAKQTCSRRSGIRGPARDFFETWKPHAKRAFTTRLFEVCGSGVFDRPGVYSVTPTLVLHEGGEEYSLQALVARANAAHDVRVRVRTGTKPFVQPPLHAPAPGGDAPAAKSTAPPASQTP